MQKIKQGYTFEMEEMIDPDNEPFDHNVHNLNNNLEQPAQNFNKSVHISDSTETDKASQTDLSADDLTKSLCELSILKREIREVTFSEESFENNNTKTKYFTGFPKSNLLFMLYNQFSNFLYVNKPKLPPFQQMLITFLRLRLNLPVSYLAYR